MNYKNYFNRNKVIDNSYTCLHFTDKMKIEINPNNNSDDGKVINIKNCNTCCNYMIWEFNSLQLINICITNLQVHRKSVKRGFEFTLMVVGESGLGKSTLVNSLFLSDLYSNRKIPPVDSRAERTTEIEKTTMEIEEKGVKVSCIWYIDREWLQCFYIYIYLFIYLYIYVHTYIVSNIK